MIGVVIGVVIEVVIAVALAGSALPHAAWRPIAPQDGACRGQGRQARSAARRDGRDRLPIVRALSVPPAPAPEPGAYLSLSLSPIGDALRERVWTRPQKKLVYHEVPGS